MTNLHASVGTHTRFKSDPTVLNETIDNLLEELRKAQVELREARENNTARANPNPNRELEYLELPRNGRTKRAPRCEAPEVPEFGTRNSDPKEAPPPEEVCVQEVGTDLGKRTLGARQGAEDTRKTRVLRPGGLSDVQVGHCKRDCPQAQASVRHVQMTPGGSGVENPAMEIDEHPDVPEGPAGEPGSSKGRIRSPRR
ncbi:hypothetical protein R1sor_001364 [Riccia sorocarpa]|uniref:Uncharacterized protein n=1 Tax=Riccia sorocarpa TaxID=122646 RepID=A0ABD3GVS1_9MARC